MGRKYSRLTGKKVDFVRWNGSTAKCVVTGAEWSIGLTIQEVETKRYVYCSNGPKSPLMKRRRFNHALHRATMQYVYDRIKAGKPLTAVEILEMYKKHDFWFGGTPSAKTCAFSQ